MCIRDRSNNIWFLYLPFVPLACLPLFTSVYVFFLRCGVPLVFFSLLYHVHKSFVQIQYVLLGHVPVLIWVYLFLFSRSPVHSICFLLSHVSCEIQFQPGNHLGIDSSFLVLSLVVNMHLPDR